MSDSVRSHWRQPTRLPHPWDSPGKNTGVGCHCLLQCMKVKSESEVVQFCPNLSNAMDRSPPGSSIHGIFQARVLEWGATAFSFECYIFTLFLNRFPECLHLTICGVAEDSWEFPWTARRCNQSILKEINLEYSLEGLMLKLKLQYVGHLMWRADSLEKTLRLGKIEGRRRRGWQRMRWSDGIIDSMDVGLSRVTKSWTWLSNWTTTSSCKPEIPNPTECQIPMEIYLKRNYCWSFSD